MVSFSVHSFTAFLILPFLTRSWTVILMPIWVLDVLTFLLIHAKRQSDIYYSFNPLVYYCLAAKVAFQLLLVIRLDVYEAIPIYVILAPFWCLLFMVSTNLFQTIINDIN